MHLLAGAPELLGFIGTPGPMEMMVIFVVAVILFGGRLPEVGRSLGRSLVEFKKGLGGAGLEDFTQTARSSSSASSSRRQSYNDVDDRDEAAAPKFDPPKAEPREEASV